MVAYTKISKIMIITERTVLRSLEREDLSLRVEWLNNNVVKETLFMRFPVSLAETELWFEKIICDNTRKDFIIERKEDSKPIGFAGYVNIDWINKKAEPFITIGEVEAWGKGFGTEVVHTLLDFGFNELGMNRMYGYVLNNNQAALNMDLKAGFLEEGILHGDVLLHGEFHNRIMLGVTKQQFNERFNIKKNNSIV
jgi:RimJ/RimL family protein N-acetyltransferase